ncbi:MAG: hypothetical protein OXU23_17095, partial [Candidatus Poribacteria bacterium]|nr:hypothetical protein [Candidatus Poribacteria bacterium]
SDKPRRLMQPMRFTDILAGMFTLYRSHFRLFLGISAVYLVVRFCTDQICMYFLIGGMGDPALKLRGFLETFLLLIFGSALIYAGAHAFLKREITVGDVLKRTLQCMSLLDLSPLIGSSILWFLSVFGPFFIIPLILGLISGFDTIVAIIAIIISIPFSVYFGVRWGLYYLPVLFEKTSAITALNRSAKLVKGSWWRVFGIMVAIVLITIMIGIILGLSFSSIFSFIIGTTAVAEFTPNDIGWFAYLIWSFVRISIYIYSTSIGCIGLALLYLDMRIRKEPDDLKIHVNRLRTSSKLT